MLFDNAQQRPSKNLINTLFLAWSVKSTAVALMVGLALTGCGKTDDPSAKAGGSMPAMPVGVIELKATSVPISAEVVAQTEGAKEVEIRPRVGGILLKKLFEEGSTVKAGQAMFLIDPVPYQIALSNAKAQLAQQEARVVQTQREATRLDSLLASQSISKREADNASSDHSMARAGLAQYDAGVREAQLNLSYTTVTSPLSGIAGRFEFSEGALVNANTSLLTKVSQISPIWVRFSLSDSELAALGGHVSPANVKDVTLVLADGTTYDKKGQLNFAASGIDPQLGTQQLRATFENEDKRLLPGQFVRIRVATGTREGVFLLPQTAILTNDQGKFVFVAEKDKEGQTVAAMRPIVEGGWQGKDWVVLSGLKAGELVIADNLIKVRPGAAVKPHPLGSAPAAMPTANNPAKKG
ncbi:efflux RND transporter periplasmic adaptor subunit [Methylotenera sp.]|uniref:efflux RND transporter periplasmic adaptor subunit n=1 Tax=Methylotenera sp. TaxID=2051956 RepID=UPI002716D491|nr:efflux RND transporter periplasmic adaptor subunit [Methylotenera sp.]MDO9204303.1 efflux RND transporter periplasmic adaptor subunit [Methylotenera sp.]MDP1523188.1 efflux RND transporter periplasmic adaptor subunit [Methylotenera sp.]MDP2071390.1 efflux RND transporter periplasmic adaptor subunit [Methylotenera sp.]MDP2229855.1 efflux RND transporter periplasmic adaptor subunit [Methylotenera sp.]MDP3005351.1 efflux RND transporter periplasmic adaptor subunit [Methylotenera sp.]